MKIHDGKMKVSLLALAVQGALVAMCGMCAMPTYAEDDEAAALKNPTNSVEIGVANTSRGSAKFGEYNGLNKSGATLVGNLSARGGDAYGGNTGTWRWSLTGTDLGTSSRTAGASVGKQGRFTLGLGYDELTHNITDSYQTPYQGSNGGNEFTLPANFGIVQTAGAGVGSGARGLNAAQQAALHTVDISTTRRNMSVNAGVNLSPQWSVAFDYNHMVQSGAKLMAFGAAGAGNALRGTIPGVSAEAVSILPNPTNYKTDTVNLALNWNGEKGNMTASYFGSFFRDAYDHVSFQTFAGNTGGTGTGANAVPVMTMQSITQTMSTPPSNAFQQLNLSGGYALAAKTKLTGGLSYGRNTQNDPFVVDSYMMITPPAVNSLNGLVVNTHADLKLANQTTDKLALSAGVKYDQRDNRTASYLYNFNSIGGATGHWAHYPNTPLSNKKTQVELAGEYRLDRGQNIRLAYNREDVKRWCNQYATGGTTLNVDSYTGVNNYPAGTNCVVATASKEDKLSATYRLKAREDVNLNVGYSYANRRTDSDPNAIAAFISVKGNTGTGTIRGINAGDFLGFHPYFNASRKQQMVKAGANWEASNRLSLGVSGRYTDDKYDTLYGVQNGKSWSMNLDATYTYGENGTIFAYLTQQHMQRDLTSAQTAATATAAATTWTNKLTGNDTTAGLGAKRGGLMGSRLELAGDLTYSLGKTGYGTQLNYVPAASCSATTSLTCGDLPDIRNRLIQFKLVGNYQVDKSGKVVLGYIYQNLKSTDYYYNGLQYGSTPSALMPTNQQSGSYSVNVVTASYLYNF